MAVLVFGLSSIRPASAVTPSPDSDEMPTNGTYSFGMGGTNVNVLRDVPASSMSGVFTVTDGSGTFAVTAGSFILNDNGHVCTGKFSGTGTPDAAGVNSGTMALTLSSLSSANCNILSPGGTGTPTTLTLYYGVAELRR